MKLLKCLRCGNALTGQQQYYCSKSCGRYFYGKQWKLNNIDKVRESARKSRHRQIVKGQEVRGAIAQGRVEELMRFRKCAVCGNCLEESQQEYCSDKCQVQAMSKPKMIASSPLHFAIEWSPEARTMTPQLRATALETKGNKCLRCGTTDNIEVHHIRPLCCNGDSDISNLMLLCQTCHDLWHKVFPDELFWTF